METDTVESTECVEKSPVRPGKLQLDCQVFRPHSVRESGGEAACDHDFESAPTIEQDSFAVWNCTRCGRAFKVEVWDRIPGLSDPLLISVLELER